jgi:hypothetical protein
VADTGVAGRLEEDVGAEDVGLDEGPRILDRAIDVRLGCEVDDRVAAGDRLGDRRRVGDVGLHEAHASRVRALEVLPAARVGELVEHDDLVAWVRREVATHVGRADEARPAADEQLHEATPRSSSRSAR